MRYRQTTVLLKNPSLFLPPMLFPLMNFLAFAGGLSRLRHVPGFEFDGGYTAFSSCSSCCSRPRSAASSPASAIARDFERGFARRLLVSAPQRGGIILGYALASMLRWAMIAIVLTIVALIAGMQIGGNGIELFGLYGLAIIFNLIGLMWACGVAMRFRSVQAGPLMQTPVFMLLFLAPVYVPLSLLQGWIHGVARFNPLTFLLEAGRGFIDGHPTQVLAAFSLAAAMLRRPDGLGAPRPAQRRARRHLIAPLRLRREDEDLGRHVRLERHLRHELDHLASRDLLDCF